MKTTQTHTPGPWRAVKSRGLNAYEIRGADGAYLADTWGVDVAIPGGVHPKASKANARLIAAAPDLLAALKELWAHTRVPATREDAPHVWAMLERVEAAIAKAEGTTGHE